MPSKLDDLLPLPPLNEDLAAGTLTRVLREEILKTGIGTAVIGLSGGIDSALSLVIASAALGSENVIAVLMPYKLSSPDSERHARLLADSLNIHCEKVDISSMADAYIDGQQGVSPLRRGNILARLRMIILYDFSAQHSALVVGTSNKTEILLGYSTLWGDMASAVNPIGDLYKTQIFRMARHFRLPAEIISKPPSADLWEGQSDEDEMKITYDLADRILYHWVDRRWSADKIGGLLREAGQDAEKVGMLLKKVQFSQFKRKMPVILKLSSTTVDREFRYPRDWGL